MKNKLRKMLSLVLSVVIAMSAISLNTFAATIMNIVNRTGSVLYSVLKGCLDKRLYGTKDLQFVVVNATAEFKTRSDLWLSGYNKIWLQR